VTESGFRDINRTVSGITWVTSTTQDVNINSQPKLNGLGILVIEGDLTLNQTGTACDFSGVLYVRGNLRFQGNLQMCGAIVVEGSILDSNNNVVSIDPDATNLSGNGDKVTYKPSVLFDITQGTGKISFTGVAGSWRQQ